MDKKLEFMECDTCRAKAGSPYLCSGCLHNRDVIQALQSEREKIIDVINEHKKKWDNDYSASRKECLDDLITKLQPPKE